MSPIINLHDYPRSLVQINLQTLSKPSDRWSRALTTASSTDQDRLGEVDEDDEEYLECDESESVAEKAALLNAASVALVDGGIAMRGVAVAVAVAIVSKKCLRRIRQEEEDMSMQVDGDANLKWVTLLDPSPREEAQAKSVHLVGYCFGGQPGPSTEPVLNHVQQSRGEMSFCESQGRFDKSQVSFKPKLLLRPC